MERKNLALLCAGVVCFWLFALAFGSAQGAGLRVQVAAGKADEAALVSAPAAQETAAAVEGLSLRPDPAGAARGGTACLGAALPRRLPDRPADGHYII